MKKFITVLLVLTAVISVQAQDKIGYISSSAILELMSATKTAQATLQSFGKQKEAQLEGLQTEYQRKVEAYQRDLATMTDIVRQSREKEIGQLEVKIQEYYKASQQELAEKERELLNPVIKVVQDAVNKVAKADGYTYVIDTDAGVGFVIYKDETRDLMTQVKTELGL